MNKYSRRIRSIIRDAEEDLVANHSGSGSMDEKDYEALLVNLGRALNCAENIESRLPKKSTRRRVKIPTR